MIDRSVLARCGAPEEPGLSLPVRASDLTDWLWRTVGESSAREALIDAWARSDIREEPASRATYGLQSAIQGMLSRAIAGPLDGSAGAPLLNFRVHDGERPWRVPPEAFAGFSGGGDLEATWTEGRLWHFDAGPGFRGLAELELPLLTTEAEAEAFKMAVTRLSAPTVGDQFLRTIRRLPDWADLMDRVRTGQITPLAADAEAERLGMGPLTGPPDPAPFDPSREAWWSYPMVIVWLVRRDLDGVREWMADYRAKWTYWHPWEGGGHVVRVMSPPIAATVLIAANRRLTHQASGAASDKMRRGAAELDGFLSQLRQALCGGKVQATGCPAGTTERKLIPAFEWADLETDGEHDALRRSGRSGSSIVWERILYSRDDVQREWPSVSSDRPTAGQRSRCQTWLAEQMRSSPESRPHPKSEYLKQARIAFGASLPERSFDTAWRMAVNETGAVAWSRAGRTRRAA